MSNGSRDDLIPSRCASRNNNNTNNHNNSITSILTSEDDEDDLQPIMQPEAQFNSLHMLYPPIENMTKQERHRALYGADPIAP